MPPIDWIPYQVLHRYPHMAPADTAIWTRYILANQTAFDAVSYDVPVGEGAAFDTVVNPDTGGDVKKLYQRKIDVVAVKDGAHYLIEVKPRASTSAIGQVKGYVRLAERDLPSLKPFRPLIVTDMLLPEMEFLAKAEGVEIRLA